MGRYTTVQTFSDNNPSVVKVPYDEKAASSNSSATDGPGSGRGDEHGSGYKVEKVNNVSGSTAGAGSGDFHHYRHTRRVEMLRMENMDKVAKVRAEEDAFAERVESKRKECEERTKKNAEKRRRKRQKRELAIEEAKKGKEGAAGKSAAVDADANAQAEATSDKFSYTPIFVESKDATAVEKGVAEALVKDDGSFMETMRKMMGAS